MAVPELESNKNDHERITPKTITLLLNEINQFICLIVLLQASPKTHASIIIDMP